MNNNNHNNLLSRSTRAQCGLTEREITVKRKEFLPTLSKIRNKGYHIVGDSDIPGKKRSPVTIWFTTGPGL